jgi:hypothetical protein
MPSHVDALGSGDDVAALDGDAELRLALRAGQRDRVDFSSCCTQPRS